MLKLDTKFRIDDAICRNPNLAMRLSEKDRKALGSWVVDGYNYDLSSRYNWERRMEAALDLALQLVEEKSFPWENCANVAFPLVTIAAIQFHSRSYPAIISGTNIVRFRVPEGTPDPDNTVTQRARRVGNLMSRQCLEDDPSWEEQHDRLLIALPILGCVFVKTYYNQRGRHNTSELVSPANLVMNYYAKSVDSCPRKTHIIPLFRNDVYERVQSGTFINVLEDSWYKALPPQEPTMQSQRADVRKGQQPPMPDETTPFDFLEQHVSIDMDGDGYAEPYIVTVEKQSRTLVRMVARWDRPEDVERIGSRILRINGTEHFTKYTFIPSPDGGIYDLGFGILLGPLNETVNTAINQLLDAGTMATTAGGFLGRGAKIRGGKYKFDPFSWNRVDSTGDDLRKSMYPLPVREPSRVLFDLLSLIIDFANRVSGSVDVMVGVTPGQNTPAETSRNALEQGQKIYASVFKRVWRAMKDEFKKLYMLNGLHLPETQRKDFLGDPNQIAPVADPHVVSDEQALHKAMTVKQESLTTPGYNLVEVERDVLSALKVEGIDRIYPGPGKVPELPPDAKTQTQQQKNQLAMAELDQRKREFVMNLMEEHRVNTAKIVNLMAQADLFMKEAGGVETGHQIAAFEAAIGALKVHNEGLSAQIKLMMEGMKANGESGSAGGIPQDTGAGGMGSGSNVTTLPVAASMGGQAAGGAQG